ncbi:MAG: DNA-directed RNA polymerase subunit beta' [Chloroflexi bacterium]|nr:DNA-directed RNA polymerase subunit beta' [Chloroflexota bacterium]
MKALRINLASPETIHSWSYGEVLKPETINYRRLRPEKDGLFDEAIFGPTRDWQCYCGKYKNPRYKGIVCEKCGVEVTRSSVRRERMGHIDLAAPIAHIWYTRRIPSYLGLLLDISRRNLDRVLYFAQYIVTYVDEEARQKALRRLEDEISVSERQLIEDVNNQIAETKKSRDVLLKQIDAKIEQLNAQYDEQVTSRYEPVIAEGQRLERELTEKAGKSFHKEITFAVEGGSQVVVKADEEVSSKHISAVQKIVKQLMEDLEKDLKSERDQAIEQLRLEKDTIRAEYEEKMDAIRAQIEDQEEITKTENAKQRDVLDELQPFTFLSEAHYRELKSKWGQVFKADMGAEAFYDILKRLDMNALAEDLWNEARTTRSKQKRKKATSRLKVVEAFRRSTNHPEWMILTVLPVIPPDLRPMVQLDGGLFATSDLNDLYRRVINRNNRLKRLLELGAPDVIVRNEKRMLQEAVDSLIDNSQRGRMLSRRGRRELRSLSDMLKGKKGRFRRNLLGKRVDYSGRSVIVVGPHLSLYQCGLPKTMALELYRPFVIAGLDKHGYTSNIKGAKRFIERNRPEIWEVLEEVIKQRPVLLNRAPTLHRLGIQAFEPVLIEGSAIQLHPLVTTAFNADFDGDQMAVHVPLSEKAVKEARELMLASKNLLKPASGEPIISPGKDMVLGVYYLTMKATKPAKGDGRVFASIDEVIMAYELEQVEVQTEIKLRVETWFSEKNDRLEKPETRMIDTTVGRAIFNDILPAEMRFCNLVLDKGGIRDLIADIYAVSGQETTTLVADRIKDIGFKYATKSGATLAVADISVPPEKEELIRKAHLDVEQVQKEYRRGLLTEQEQNENIIRIWQDATKDVGDAVRKHLDPQGNLSTMAISGATKGGFSPIAQMAGMRGLMADPSGRIIPMPIQSNFREGLTALEYFISTHGARKGLADTALRTADAGYLTRRLVDIAQDMIINNEDCGTEEGIYIDAKEDVAGQPFSERIYGRLLAERVVHPETGEIIAERNDLLTKELTQAVIKANVQVVKVRSPLSCELIHGVCARCYGIDLGRGKMVNLGSAVGIVAAQSIGEPGTQLTLRTFHTGGVAAGGDITTGLPRVEELFEARRMPKGEAIVSTIKGTAHIISSEKNSEQRMIRVDHSEMISDTYEVPEGWKIQVDEEAEVSMGDPIASQEGAVITAAHAGRVRIENGNVIVSYENRESEDYEIPSTSRIIISDGAKVEAGQPLTEGSINPHTILKIKGRDATELYLLKEIQQVYRTQGQNINDKHFEVVIRKMLNKVQITRPGDTPYLPQDLVDRLELRKMNEQLVAEGKKPARFVEVLLGISKASLSTDSFLSASSFQHTIKVLAGAAIASKEDPLYGLKENVIIGKLIPAGTGFEPGRFAEQSVEAQPGKPEISVEQMNIFANEDREDPEFEMDEFDDEDLADFSENDETIDYDN